MTNPKDKPPLPLTNAERQARRRASGARVKLDGVTVPRAPRDELAAMAERLGVPASELWERAGLGLVSTAKGQNDGKA